MFGKLFKLFAAIAIFMGIGRNVKKKPPPSNETGPTPTPGPDSVTFTPSNKPPKDVNNNFNFGNDDVEIRSPG